MGKAAGLIKTGMAGRGHVSSDVRTRRRFLTSAGAGLAAVVAGCLEDNNPPEYDVSAFLSGEEKLADHQGKRILVHGDTQYSGNTVRGDDEYTGNKVFVRQEDGSFDALELLHRAGRIAERERAEAVTLNHVDQSLDPTRK